MPGILFRKEPERLAFRHTNFDLFQEVKKKELQLFYAFHS